MPNPSLDQLTRAIKISEQIAELETELASIFGGTAQAPTVKRAYTKRAESSSTSPDTAAPPKTRRKKKAPVFSAEARERISAAMKKRWAKVKKEAKKAEG